MDRLRAVIFDIDGTLINSVDAHARAWQEILKEYGVQATFEEIRHQIGKGGDQLMPIFLPAELVRARGNEIEKERSNRFKDRYLRRIHAFADVRALLERVHAVGLAVGLASSARGEELRDYVKIADISDLVDHMTSSEDADRSKPHPDIFAVALKKLGVNAEEAVAVGDSPYDAEAARKLNLPIVGVLCGGFPESELRAAGCIAIYRDPADLLAHFDDSPLSPRSRR